MDMIASQFVNLCKDETEKMGVFGHKNTTVTQ